MRHGSDKRTVELAFTTVASGLVFPEGPVALADGGLLCVEVLAGRLTRVGPDGGVSVVAQLGGGPNGAAIGPDGRCYVCNNGGHTPEKLAKFAAGAFDDTQHDRGCVQVVDLETGAFETLYDSCEGVPLSAPNDLVFDSTGGFYFTDYGDLLRSIPKDDRVYYARADGSGIQLVADVFVQPNGIGLSPDGSVLYVAETRPGRLRGFPILRPGVVDLSATPGEGGAMLYQDPALPLDSLAVQADGRICVACPRNDLILRVTPAGVAERLPTPAGSPANICFGGPGRRTAYVALLRAGTLLAAAWDAPGLALNFEQVG